MQVINVEGRGMSVWREETGYEIYVKRDSVGERVW